MWLDAERTLWLYPDGTISQRFLKRLGERIGSGFGWRWFDRDWPWLADGI